MGDDRRDRASSVTREARMLAWATATFALVFTVAVLVWIAQH